MTESISRAIGEPILYSDISLHGVYFAASNAPCAAVLLVPPLFEEKRCAHRALTSCARAFANADVAVLHADLYGTGNSHGDLSEIDLDRWIDDLYAAVDYLGDRTPGIPITVLACRAGALVAAQAIVAGLSADRFIAWQPVTTGRGYLNQLRTRRMIQDKMTGDTSTVLGDYEVEGQDLSPALYASLMALRIPTEISSVSLSLIQCSFNEKLLTEYEKLVTQWGAESVRTRTITCEPFWNPHSPGEYHELTQAILEEVLA